MIHKDGAGRLNRFVEAQQAVYPAVIDELRQGEKRSHWMWFIFPQIAGLGRSATAHYYAIENIEEACSYLNHPLLGRRLHECAQLLLYIENRSAAEIFGYTDERKLRSSMTLFEQAAEEESIFSAVLEKYFEGSRDGATLELLEQLQSGT